MLFTRLYFLVTGACNLARARIEHPRRHYLKISSFDPAFFRGQCLIGDRRLIEENTVCHYLVPGLTHTQKCSIRDMEKASNKFQQEAPTITIFLCKLFNKLLAMKNIFSVIYSFCFSLFTGKASTFEKVVPKLFQVLIHVHDPCHQF